MHKIFIDTNVLVYATDQNEKKKSEKAKEMLKDAQKKHELVISTQVIQEFYVTTCNKLKIDPRKAKEIIKSFNFEVVSITEDLIFEAMDCSFINQISFWDSLILMAAESANCSTLWSEDLNNGQIIRGVKIENIFS